MSSIWMIIGPVLDWIHQITRRSLWSKLDPSVLVYSITESASAQEKSTGSTMMHLIINTPLHRAREALQVLSRLGSKNVLPLNPITFKLELITKCISSCQRCNLWWRTFPRNVIAYQVIVNTGVPLLSMKACMIDLECMSYNESV